VTNDTLNVICVCGARPNFMKVAPLLTAFRATGRIDAKLVHTGQHYDAEMSALFFDQLGIPRPDVNLEVGSGSHAVQTAEVMKRFEPLLKGSGFRSATGGSADSDGGVQGSVSGIENVASPLVGGAPGTRPDATQARPDWVIVVGDVNSTLACALVAAKLGIKVAHVEAGLRSFDRSMPEEINRLLTDAISDLLFVSEPSGVENLRREGIPEERIRFVGNVMIDTLMQHRARANKSNILHDLNLVRGEYVTVTLHRPSNVDSPEALACCLEALDRIAREMPVIFPIHPRTRQKLMDSDNPQIAQMAQISADHSLRKSAKSADRYSGLRTQDSARTRDSGLCLISPLGYLDFLKLMSHSAVVLTDSGGIQEETTILGVPCLTLRPNTERPITVTHGTNRLVPLDPSAIYAAFRGATTPSPSQGEGRGEGPGVSPPLWDGRAAERIASQLLDLHTASREDGELGNSRIVPEAQSAAGRLRVDPTNDWVGRVVDFS
jgi:UDP-N-acetylglucosamine 2-epimerase (non-hydrolysing)